MFRLMKVSYKSLSKIKNSDFHETCMIPSMTVVPARSVLYYEVPGLSGKTRDDPAGSSHILAVLFPEMVEHHLFFELNPKPVQW